jgi:hypothetical protein
MMKTVFLTTVLGLFVFSGMAMANQVKVIELDEALCKKLALAYATDPSTLTVQEISALEFCLALTLAQRPDTAQPAAPVGLSIRSQSSSTGNPDITPPQPPKDVTIQ